MKLQIVGLLVLSEGLLFGMNGRSAEELAIKKEIREQELIRLMEETRRAVGNMPLVQLRSIVSDICRERGEESLSEDSTDSRSSTDSDDNICGITGHYDFKIKPAENNSRKK